jgi:hypothetical protein
LVGSAELTMSVIALVSSKPLRSTAHVRGALTLRKDRDFKLRLTPRGLDIAYMTRRAFDLNLDLSACPPIDFAGGIAPELARRIAASVGHNDNGFALIDLEPDEATPLAHAIARAGPQCGEHGIPIIDGYSLADGLLLPVELVRQHFTKSQIQSEKGPTMAHPLQRSAPRAYNLLKEICDDSNKVIDEVILYELARAQAFCKRVDHIQGNKPPRAKTLTEAEIDAVAKPYAAKIARGRVSEFNEPLIDPLPDGTIALIPILGQDDEVNVILLACFVSHGTPGSMRMTLDIDEVLPAISREVLEAIGRKSRV